MESTNHAAYSLVSKPLTVFHFIMPRRRRSSLLEDLFDVLEMIFRVVPPWVSIPVAIVGFGLIAILMPTFTGPFDFLNVIKLLFAGIFAIVCLAAGFKAHQTRQRQQDFLTENLDIGWLNNLSHRSPVSACMSALQSRAKRGQNAGQEFWGCSTFPTCRGVRNLDRVDVH